MTAQAKKIAVNTNWAPNSWQFKPAKQLPFYEDEEALKQAQAELSQYPPLIFAGEARSLKKQLAAVSRGEAFLFQGGDCAESFQDLSSQVIRDLFRVLLQSSAVLSYAGGKPIVKIGRMAGQFAKPRSSAMEVIDGVELPSYKGDIINGFEPTMESRKPDPQRMVKAYFHSASKLNLLRALASGGYADLRKVQQWIMEFVSDSPAGERYQALADEIAKALSFIDATGLGNADSIREIELYTSHEALLLPYEESMARIDSLTDVTYATSGHFLWIGDRTRQPDGAHVEFLRGVDNPIGIKCGPSMEVDDLKELLEILNPENEAGRITLITRVGAGKVADHLPKFINAVKEEGANVVWCSDPMHGNTHKSESGYKTRSVSKISSEIHEFFEVCRAENVYPGGIHLEMTGMNVTECVGGIREVKDMDLGTNYDTLCDPRLNASQALELAFEVADLLKQG